MKPLDGPVFTNEYHFFNANFRLVLFGDLPYS